MAGPSVASQRGPCERPGGCPAVAGTALQSEPGCPPSPPPWLLGAWPTAQAPVAHRRGGVTIPETVSFTTAVRSPSPRYTRCFVLFRFLVCFQDKRFEQRCEGTHRLHPVLGGDPDLGRPFQECGFAPESLGWGLKGNWVRLGHFYLARPTRNVSCSLGQAANPRTCQSLRARTPLVPDGLDQLARCLAPDTRTAGL